MSGATSRRPARPRSDRLTAGRGPLPSASAIGRRRILVGLAKRVLPLVALALLSLVALWPEIVQQADRARLIYRHAGLVPESGVLTAPRYRGEDDSRQAYTLTATTARQVGPERIDFVRPIGDILLGGGGWLQVVAASGTYLQKAGQLDLSGDVILYRDDGTLLITDSATLDIREGVAASGAPVRVEGPFGTLDAQGFTITERGRVAQFAGPGRLVLNGGKP
jgi:lipopolysaccharide export system protein LptC